ncbi:hypothetical protein FQZ97_792200 [compost metagenome]
MLNALRGYVGQPLVVGLNHRSLYPQILLNLVEDAINTTSHVNMGGVGWGVVPEEQVRFVHHRTRRV